jgi:ribosome-associated toxin RatA of RatAB toxin-antitoxin module
MQTLDRDEASIVVTASPRDVYALVADVTRTPEFSPEVTRCTWLDGARGPAVGARFEAVNTNARGKSWKNRPVVTVADPGSEFAVTRSEPFAGTLTWRYRFEPVEGGTRVTESYEVEKPVTRLGWFVIEHVFKDRDRRGALRDGMRTTLERLKVAAESGSGVSADRHSDAR